MKNVVVVGSFDDLRSRHIRLLEEAAKLGEVHALIWPDAGVKADHRQTGQIFGRRAALHRPGDSASSIPPISPPAARPPTPSPDWTCFKPADLGGARGRGDRGEEDLLRRAGHRAAGHPRRRPDRRSRRRRRSAAPPGPPARQGHRHAAASTGCIPATSASSRRRPGCGDLFVDVGSDDNIRMLKGKNHPLLPQDTGSTWSWSVKPRHPGLHRLRLRLAGRGARDQPHQAGRSTWSTRTATGPEKRAFCEERDIQYVVLKRLPKSGLPRRDSTGLRGF